VTPWCVAEFGSLAACERYGKAILDKGTDGDARKKYIDDDMSEAEGGDDAATVKWAKGDNPFGRVGVLTLGAIAATLFAALTVTLAFTALMAFVGCLLLLIIGVFFVCMWIIPGKPRQWGMSWFEALLGLVLQSFLAMLVFSVTLTLVTAVFGLTDNIGWLPVSGLAIAVLVAGFRLRRLLESLTTVMRPGMGSMVMGGMARRGAMSAVRRLMGAVGSRAASPSITERGREKANPQERAERVASSRVFRQSPPAGSYASVAGNRPAHELPIGPDRRAIEGVAASNGSSPGGRLAGLGRRGDGSPNGQGRNIQALQVARVLGAADGSKRGKKRSVPVNGHTSAAMVGETAARGSSARSVRHARSGAQAQVAARGLEPRAHTHSASLRDGPPKGHRERRRPSAPSGSQRRFREYSSVTKDGVTVLVPNRR